MKIIAAAVLLAGVIVGSAYAADQPVVGPAPAWVRPVTAAPAAEKPSEAAYSVLLSDQQISLERGRRTVYSETAVKIQTPQGLAIGNLSLPWRPDTDVLTVHKLIIRRGAQVIDVLASGQTFTVVRREPNLESAMLDGVLTANMQIDDLQVGDILELASSVVYSDPVLKDHVEQTAAAWNSYPIQRAHMRIQWPSNLTTRLRQTGALPAITPVKSGGVSQVELTLNNLEPAPTPNGAPARYRLGRLVELTDASWADIGALMAPLYSRAAVLPAQGPLHDQLERIRALSTDPKVRAEAALALVQDRIRYVALVMGAGGLVPADAETTWSRRYGDCKAKTALLLALLHALDIQADAVVVNSTSGDGLDQRLPMVGLFDHVLVRAVIAGQTYWLDGTRTGDTSLERLNTPNFGWGLPLVGANAALVRTVPPPRSVPDQATTIRIDARRGISLPAPTVAESVFTGDAAVGINAGLANLAGEARDRALREYWRRGLDFVEATSTSAAFDTKTGELRLRMEGVAKMDWSNGQFETSGTDVGFKADFARDPGPDRDAPFAVTYPVFTRTTETVLLPPSFSAVSNGDAGAIDETVAGVEYRRRYRMADSVFTIEQSQRSVAPEFPAKDAPAAQARLRALADKSIYIVKPANYRLTDEELTASLATPQTTAAAYLARGDLLIERGRHDEAIKDFEGALRLDPKSAPALAGRAFARASTGRLEGALEDIRAANAISPRVARAWVARGLVAEVQGKPKDAVAAYSTALEIEPRNAIALSHRIALNRTAGDAAAADRDAAGVKASPLKLDSQHLLALSRGGKHAQAVAELEAMVSEHSGSLQALLFAGVGYGVIGEHARAVKTYDQAIALQPSAGLYLMRMYVRPAADVAARKADLEAALKLEPGSALALTARAMMQAGENDLPGAFSTLDGGLAASPRDPDLLHQRGLLFLRTGKAARAEEDFKAARAATEEPQKLNQMCWDLATHGASLPLALADCDAAVAKSPEQPAYLDSRAFVLLRLGRFDESIESYTRALEKTPNLAQSLYGRGVAWARKGDKAQSDADIAAALKGNPNVRAEFERYGVTL